MKHFLKQLEETTLETLDALVSSNGSHMSGELFAAVLLETANLISDTDLHLSHLGLRLTVAIRSSSVMF